MKAKLILIIVMALLWAKNSNAQLDTNDGTIKTMVRTYNEDYKTARENFSSKLIHIDRAPGRWDTLKTPERVNEVKFLSNGDTLKAWMNVPSKNKKYPAVIFLHGGFSFGLEDWTMTQAYRDSGFVVFSPMLRGENGQQGTFTMFYDETDDVLASIKYLKSLPYIDADRIYLSGHSVGGTIAMLTSMLTTEIKAAASFSGSPDQMIYCKYGIPAKLIPFDTNDVRECEMRSPLSYARSFKIPMRIYYGSDEPHFRLSSEEMVKYAKESGADIELVQIQGDHMSAIPEEVARSIGFFRSSK
jgi:dipeptidyl aminopeptidase/acylaminoacyl peptidase